MKILHIITGLHKSGAELNLFNLVSEDKINKHTVISLLGNNFYGKKLEKKGIKVYYLSLNKNIFYIYKGIRKIINVINSENPDVVQSWMYHADIIGGLVSRFCGVKKYSGTCVVLE